MREILWHSLGVVTMSLDLPLGAWPVTLALTALAAWSMYRLVGLRRFVAWPTLALLVSSIIVFVGIPFYATAFWAHHGIATPETQRLPTDVLGVMMWGYFAFVALTIAAAKGYRWPLAGVAGLLVWMNFGIMLIASMAVSGVWL
jgi:hypothetical protein